MCRVLLAALEGAVTSILFSMPHGEGGHHRSLTRGEYFGYESSHGSYSGGPMAVTIERQQSGRGPPKVEKFSDASVAILVAEKVSSARIEYGPVVRQILRVSGDKKLRDKNRDFLLASFTLHHRYHVVVTAVDGSARSLLGGSSVRSVSVYFLYVSSRPV